MGAYNPVNQLDDSSEDPNRARIYYKEGGPVVFFRPDRPVNFAAPLINTPGWYACPHNRATRKLLLGEGIVPPDNIEGYPWNGPFTPYEHQPRAVENLVDNFRAWILDDPRTGKTPVASWGVDILMRRGDVKRVLILSPRRIVKSTWLNTLFKIMPHVKMENGNGATGRFKKICQDPTIQIVVANHDKMRLAFKDIIAAKFDLVIVDEVNMFRHHTSGRAGKLKNLLAKKSIRAWFMTGTINSGTPDTLYDLVRMINPQMLRMTLVRWRNLTMYPVPIGDQQKWKQQQGVEHLIQAVLTPCTRAQRHECFDVPDVTFHCHELDLVPAQKKALELLRKDRMFYEGTKLVTAVNPAVLVGKILQIAGGSVYTSDGERDVIAYDKHLEERAEVVIEEWRQTQSKVIALSSYTHQLDAIAAIIERRTNCGVLKLNGKTTDKQADELEGLFQNDSHYQFVVADPDSIQHGFTLSAANTVVWLSPTWKPEAWIQANDRVFGPLSAIKQTLGIVYCVATATERRIFNHLLNQEERVRSELDLVALCEKFARPN